MSYLDTLLDQYDAHVAREFGRMDFAKIQEKRTLALESEKGKFVSALAEHVGRALSSVETAAARGLFDQCAPLDLDVLKRLPKDPVPDAVAFGKVLERLRALVLERADRKEASDVPAVLRSLRRRLRQGAVAGEVLPPQGLHRGAGPAGVRRVHARHRLPGG
jgi:hypothetical protein